MQDGIYEISGGRLVYVRGGMCSRWKTMENSWSVADSVYVLTYVAPLPRMEEPKAYGSLVMATLPIPADKELIFIRHSGGWILADGWTYKYDWNKLNNPRPLTSEELENAHA